MDSVIIIFILFGVVLLIFNCIAICEIINSTRSRYNKLMWCIFIFFFPPFGIICYYLTLLTDEYQPLLDPEVFHTPMYPPRYRYRM